jgi:hypothetical protein|tara:strand:+ start:8322 stop:8624 length:303 start_codon:yes stop_codon:yes gene_type:complete
LRHLLAFTLVLFISLPAYGLRCGTNLVEEGDLKIHIRDICGEPLSVEVIGYTLRTERHTNGYLQEREHILEEWIYKRQSKYYDVLTFEAGRLVRIEKIRR